MKGWFYEILSDGTTCCFSRIWDFASVMCTTSIHECKHFEKLCTEAYEWAYSSEFLIQPNPFRWRHLLRFVPFCLPVPNCSQKSHIPVIEMKKCTHVCSRTGNENVKILGNMGRKRAYYISSAMGIMAVKPTRQRHIFAFSASSAIRFCDWTPS